MLLLQKADTVRVARASALVRLGPAAYAALHSDSLTKGSASSVLAAAELAGTMAAKQTPSLIPLCHNLLLTRAAVRAAADPATHAVRITSEVRTVGKTGVEMEALTAAAVAALTVYDMCKAASKAIVVEEVRLEAKSGGSTGNYEREPGYDECEPGESTDDDDEDGEWDPGEWCPGHYVHEPRERTDDDELDFVLDRGKWCEGYYVREPGYYPREPGEG